MNEQLAKALESIKDKEGFKKKIEELNKLNLSKDEEQSKLMEIFKEFGVSDSTFDADVELSEDDLDKVIGGCDDFETGCSGKWFFGIACTGDIMSWIGSHSFG